ncbi:MAG: Dabb family protein [Clostridiales bacterium]|nr:Dabb family protein [Clostridiales bacterium]
MVRHIVAWNFRDEFMVEENKIYAEEIKRELENLKNLIDGIVSIEVLIDPLFSSESDILLDSVFVDEEAYRQYQVHPEHVRVGNNVVRPRTCNRKCVDFYIS